MTAPEKAGPPLRPTTGAADTTPPPRPPGAPDGRRPGTPRTSGSAAVDLALGLADPGPGAGGAYLGARRDRAAARGAALLDAAGLTVDAALAAATADERLDEVLVRAVEAAVATAEPRLPRALGRALRAALDARDDEALEEARAVVATLAALDAAHVRLVAFLVRSEQPRTQDHDGVAYATRRDFHLSNQLKGTTGLPESLWPVLMGHLVALGVLIEERSPAPGRGSVGGLGRPTEPLRSWAFSHLGRSVARTLADGLPAPDAPG